MPSPRRFPPPWTIDEHTESFIVCDATGQALGYFYFEDEPAGFGGGLICRYIRLPYISEVAMRKNLAAAATWLALIGFLGWIFYKGYSTSELSGVKILMYSLIGLVMLGSIPENNRRMKGSAFIGLAGVAFARHFDFTDFDELIFVFSLMLGVLYLSGDRWWIGEEK
jgi:hypothetical protein